jgi:hypothetical protein
MVTGQAPGLNPNPFVGIAFDRNGSYNVGRAAWLRSKGFATGHARAGAGRRTRRNRYAESVTRLWRDVFPKACAS